MLNQIGLFVKSLSTILPRWIPAAIVMLVIFFLSSRSSESLPDFATWDFAIKKSAHMFGYGMLARAYLHFFGNTAKGKGLAWLLSLLYAVTDEFHQSFVPGRYASIYDVILFDNLGAAFALWFGGKRK